MLVLRRWGKGWGGEKIMNISFLGCEKRFLLRSRWWWTERMREMMKLLKVQIQIVFSSLEPSWDWLFGLGALYRVYLLSTTAPGENVFLRDKIVRFHGNFCFSRFEANMRGTIISLGAGIAIQRNFRRYPTLISGIWVKWYLSKKDLLVTFFIFDFLFNLTVMCWPVNLSVAATEHLMNLFSRLSKNVVQLKS